MNFKDRIKQELDKVNNAGQSFNNDDLFWRPVEGKTIIRLLPNPFVEDGFPFLKLQLYYRIFGKTVVSPASFGNDDPILSFARDLYNTKDEDKINAARKLFPQTRTFVLVLVKDAQGNVIQGPSWWNFGKTIYQELLGIMSDDDYGNISDPKEGRDITVEYKLGAGKNEQEQRFNATTMIRVKPSVTPAFTEEEVAEKIKNVTNITDVYQTPTSTELEVMLKEYLNNNSTNSDSEKPTTDDSKPQVEQTPKKETSTKVSEGVDKLESMFNELED